jgi:hypothetical protein
MFIKERSEAVAFLWLLLIPVILFINYIMFKYSLMVDAIQASSSHDPNELGHPGPGSFIYTFTAVFMLAPIDLCLIIIMVFLIIHSYKSISFKNSLRYMLLWADENPDEPFPKNAFDIQRNTIKIKSLIYLIISGWFLYKAIQNDISIIKEVGFVIPWDMIIVGIIFAVCLTFFIVNCRKTPSSIIFHSKGFEIDNEEIAYKNIESISSSCSLKNLTSLPGSRCVIIKGDFGEKKFLIGQDHLGKNDIRIGLLTYLYQEARKNNILVNIS